MSEEELERAREVSDRVREHLRRYNQVLPGTRIQAAPLLPDLLDEIDRLRAELREAEADRDALVWENTAAQGQRAKTAYERNAARAENDRLRVHLAAAHATLAETGWDLHLEMCSGDCPCDPQRASCPACPGPQPALNQAGRKAWESVSKLVYLGLGGTAPRDTRPLEGQPLGVDEVMGAVNAWMRKLAGPCATARVMAPFPPWDPAAELHDRGPCTLWADHGPEHVGAWQTYEDSELTTAYESALRQARATAEKQLAEAQS